MPHHVNKTWLGIIGAGVGLCAISAGGLWYAAQSPGSALVVVESPANPTASTPDDFLQAIFKQDTNTVRSYLQQGVDPNQTLNSVPLLHALMMWPNRVHPDMVDLLAEYGADVTAPNGQGDTLLHLLAVDLPIPEDWASQVGKRLIAHGADVNARNRHGTPVLEAALCAETPNNGFVAELIDSGADLKALNPHAICNTTLLHLAARVNHPALVEYALAQGIAVNAVDATGQTPLHYLRGSSAGEVLLTQGANLDAKDIAGRSPLESAICSLHGAYPLKAEVIDWFLTHGAKTQSIGATIPCGGNSPPVTLMTQAVGADSAELARLAIAKGSNPQAKDETGRTPLHNASRFNATAVAEVLVSAGAEINAVDAQGYTPLHIAAIHRNLQVAQYLIAQGAAVNATDHEGHTPLYEAQNLAWDADFQDRTPDQTQALVDLLHQFGGQL